MGWSEYEVSLKIIREFVNQYVRTRARDIDRGAYPRDIIRKLGELNFLAPTLPPEFGGAGADTLTHILVVEELARASPGVATIMEIQSSMIAENIYHNGTKRMKEEILPKVAAGEVIVAFALSEPCCGSDAAAIRTRAEKIGGEWVINGHKMWITSGLYADYYLLFARTGPLEARHKAITAFLIPRSNCVEATPIEVMGVRGTGTAEVKFNSCKAGDEDVVGEVNGGWSVAMWGINMGRLNVGAIGLGIAEEAFYQAYDYAHKREAFGRLIADFQAIQHYLAEMYARVEALRALVYKTAKMRDENHPDFPLYAQVAKLMGSRTAVETARLAVQILGGYGYSTDSHVEMLYRDAKVTEIYEGTNEIILNTIYKFLKSKFT
ncbi:acyl-CoA dehydrogenase [Pyrobaculum aerophilum str. IM2]|uniref:Acyl-CoA dehydrogenase n=2 Tax=Pyrobaculum aerophilum TaxID=13773 RepID=Q8ZV35_PYRAE|nr:MULTISPECIES: acyl-CoA dehydrogenase family protein [Pyrobaculum]AAL64221.1 acyl-CoA dehydrogenase [Pyrobaculum aerophilum str. IM2]HII47019.1 acyl-CoA dehydrogenase [Pyrobaculum aerophilum]